MWTNQRGDKGMENDDGHRETNSTKKTYRLLSRAKDQINRGAYKYKRGLTARRRSKSISDKLKEVHKPWHQRSTDNSENNSGTILFDLT